MGSVANWVWVLSGILLLGLFVWFFRRRKKERKTFIGHEKHAGGYLKYHPNTAIKIRRGFLSKGVPAAVKANEVAKGVVVVRFDGDIQASDRCALSHIFDEVILNKEKIEEVVVLVTSRGGQVAEYGHAYSEMCRIRELPLKLTVCIDTVAASGGYLMSLPANQILAAPFAMVGSIGVVSFVPNLRGLLKKLSIEPRTFTSGKYKRTITFTDDASEADSLHYKQQLELIHGQFKMALKKFRPEVDLDRVATGEVWLAGSSVDLDLKIVDSLKVSSEYLLELNQRFDLVEFSESEKRSSWKRFLKNVVKISDSLSNFEFR